MVNDEATAVLFVSLPPSYSPSFVSLPAGRQGGVRGGRS